MPYILDIQKELLVPKWLLHTIRLKKETLKISKTLLRSLNNEIVHDKIVGWGGGHANGDADVLIGKTAVISSLLNPTVLLGKDTYLLVLLFYCCEPDSETLIFTPITNLRYGT